jgi:hypothetical protein
MISAGARYVTSRRPCTVTIQPGRASASSVTTGRPGLPGRLKGVPGDDHLHGYPPDRNPDREPPEKAVPRWKRYRLRNPEKDTEQRASYYRRNRDKIAANGRIRYLKEKEAKLASINAQRWVISKGVT